MARQSVLPSAAESRPQPQPLAWSGTKITPPLAADAAANPRLAARLDIALTRSLVWIHGPPGAGKTTLVAHHLAAIGVDPIWYRLDAEDSDPASFFFYAALAAARTDPARQARLPALRPEYLREADGFSRRFFRALLADPTPTVLVLDDYHELAAGSAVHRCLAEGLGEFPPSAHLIVVSRAPPPREFARARVSGQVEIVPPQTLRLTAEEAGAIADHRSIELAPSLVETLVARTQGWAGGLILMMEAARSQELDLTQGGERVPELLFDYFASEIFHRMGEREQRTLLVLALPPSIATSVAGFLAENEGAVALLDDLERRSYYTVRDDEAEANFRFHPLFREFLKEAGAVFDAATRRRLELRAAQAMERCAQIEAAVTLYQEAEAWGELARVICEWAPKLVEAGRHATLLGWIERVPATLAETSGWLMFWHATALSPDAPKRSRPLFHRAYALFEDAGDAAGILLAWAGLASSIADDPSSDQAELDRDIALLRAIMAARGASFPSPAVEFRVSLAMYLALVRRSPDRIEIGLWRERALASAAALGKPGLTILMRYYIALYALIDGDFATFREQLEAAPPAEALGREPLLQQVAHVAIGLGQLYGQIPGRCAETAERALAASKESGIYLWTHFQAGFEAIVESDLPRARKWIKRTAQLSGKVAVYHSAHYQMMATGAALLAGDIDGAIRSGELSVEMTRADGWFLYEAMARCRLAEAYESAGRFADADAELEAAEAATGRIAAGAMKISLDFLRADFLLQRGRDREGLAALAAAIAWGERTGAVRTLLTPLRNARLCARALAAGLSPDWVRTFIRTSALPAPDRSQEEWPWPFKITTFGTLQISRDGVPLTLSRKTPRRLMTVLKAIITFGAVNVPETRIVDAVWPNDEADAAHHALDVALYRLRKLIGIGQALVVKDGKVSLDPAHCWLDVWAFEALCRKGDPGDRARIAALYKGGFLADDELPWAAARQRQLAAMLAKAS